MRCRKKGCEKAEKGKYLDPADAKVSNLGAATNVQQDVLRLQIPVHHAGVQVCQPLCHVVCNLQVTPPHLSVVSAHAWQRRSFDSCVASAIKNSILPSWSVCLCSKAEVTLQ